MNNVELLSTTDVARFAAKGVLKFEGIIDQHTNDQFLADVGHVSEDQVDSILSHYGKTMASSAIPLVPAGTPLARAYPAESALAKIMRHPVVAGAVQSLVGDDCVLDHHFLHITFPKRLYDAAGQRHTSQHTHQDSTIDPRRAFDIQLMYFPHAVTREMGGTRYLPGSHLRVVSEAAISRYQNIRGQQHVVCPAGTVLLLHHGIWHGGGYNASEQLRYMFKIRLCPTKAQTRLWNLADYPRDTSQRPIFWTSGQSEPENLATILTSPEPWFEADTGRLEYLNRIRLWRYLSGDENYDADYWLTRVENEH